MGWYYKEKNRSRKGSKNVFRKQRRTGRAPNFVRSARLDTATKQFHVPFRVDQKMTITVFHRVFLRSKCMKYEDLKRLKSRHKTYIFCIDREPKLVIGSFNGLRKIQSIVHVEITLQEQFDGPMTGGLQLEGGEINRIFEYEKNLWVAMCEIAEGSSDFDSVDEYLKNQFGKEGKKIVEKKGISYFRSLRQMQDAISKEAVKYMEKEGIGLNELALRLERAGQTIKMANGEVDFTPQNIAEFASVLGKCPRITFE